MRSRPAVPSFSSGIVFKWVSAFRAAVASRSLRFLHSPPFLFGNSFNGKTSSAAGWYPTELYESYRSILPRNGRAH